MEINPKRNNYGTKNFRGSKSTNANEDGSVFNSYSSYWNLGFLFFSRKIKSTLYSVRDNGQRSSNEYRIPDQVAEGVTVGSLPADSEQFMLIEELYKQMDKLQTRVDSMLHNEVGIKALDKAVDKLQKDVEKLKDKQRDFANGG